MVYSVRQPEGRIDQRCREALNDQRSARISNRPSLVHQNMQLSFIVPKFLYGLLDIDLAGRVHLQPKMNQCTTFET